MSSTFFFPAEPVLAHYRPWSQGSMEAADLPASVPSSAQAPVAVHCTEPAPNQTAPISTSVPQSIHPCKTAGKKKSLRSNIELVEILQQRKNYSECAIISKEKDQPNLPQPNADSNM